MPLTLVLGPANSAKAGEVLGAYADAAPRGALLVVPRTRDAEHYSRELSADGCVLRTVLTFPRLLALIAERAGLRAGTLTALQREQVIRRAIAGAGLRVLDEVARTRGFAAAAGELIAELGRSLVSAPRFAEALGRWAQDDPRRGPYASDVGAIYLAYARELDRLGRVDGELFAWRALDALRSAPARWGGDAVFFYGFDDLNELERDAIETLARIVEADVTVSLTYESARGALSARAELVAELGQLAGRVVELPPADEYYEPSSRVALHHLERSLFESASGGSRPDPGDAVVLLEAGGELAESELVCGEIAALLGAGAAPGEIAVVFRTLGSGARALAHTAARYGIPYVLDRPLEFAHTALGRGLIGLARCALLGGDATASDLLAYLRTPGAVGRPERVDALEVQLRRGAIRTAQQAREASGLELREIDGLASAGDKLGELARQGRRLLAAPHRERAPVLDQDERRDALALAALTRCAGELAELSAAPDGRDLTEVLEGLRIAAEPAAPDAVLITDPLAIRARRYRAVFVCGLQEGAFPLTPAPEPFLSDERRRELAVAAGLALRLREDVLDRERYLFYACVSRATERLVLSYRSSDEEGNVATPSPFIDDVSELLDPDWRARRRRRLLADVVWPPDEAPSPRELARAQAAAEGDGADRAAPAVPRRLGAAALSQARHTEVLSAGALESYADCHMKWLVERELRPLALEPTAEPLVRGSYVHDVLERVLSRLGRAVTPESLPDAVRLVAEAMAAAPPELAPGRSQALRRSLAAAIAADLRRYLEYEASTSAGWAPRSLELRFGFDDEGESLPPLVLGEPGEAISLRGAIDRVDVDGSGHRAVVRDYKSGGAKDQHRGNRWRSDQSLQVALYMIAVRELLGLDPVAGLYQPLGGRDLRPRGVYLDECKVQDGLLPADARDAEGLRAELNDASERALALAAALRAGELEPCPETCSRDGCRYPGICRA